jgi:hypothetical protein
MLSVAVVRPAVWNNFHRDIEINTYFSERAVAIADRAALRRRATATHDAYDCRQPSLLASSIQYPAGRSGFASVSVATGGASSLAPHAHRHADGESCRHNGCSASSCRSSASCAGAPSANHIALGGADDRFSGGHCLAHKRASNPGVRRGHEHVVPARLVKRRTETWRRHSRPRRLARSAPTPPCRCRNRRVGSANPRRWHVASRNLAGSVACSRNAGR